RRLYPQGEILYAILLGDPGRDAVIKSLSTELRLFNREVEYVELLGYPHPPEWVLDDTGLRVKLPEEKPCRNALVIKVVAKKGG
ncbi:MAG: alpha-L-fucosidase, partial [Thermoprotei archaeon]